MPLVSPPSSILIVGQPSRPIGYAGKKGIQPGRVTTSIRLDPRLAKRTNAMESSAGVTQCPTSTSRSAPLLN